MPKKNLDERLKFLAQSKPITQQELRQKPVKHRGERTEVFKFGELNNLADNNKLGCVLLNLSEHGARIKINCVKAITGPIAITIPAAGFRKLCEVRWQSGMEFGLQFQE